MRFIKTYESYNEQYYIDYILNVNESINESLIDRLKTVARKGALTATMLTALMSNPTFAKEYDALDQVEKNKIENTIKSDVKAKQEIDISNSFKSGAYELSDAQKADVIKQMEALKEYHKANPSKLYTLTIIASESQVPNKDIKTKESLETLELSKRRAQTLKPIVENFIMANNLNIKLKVQTLVGKTEWDASKGKDAKEYQDEQFVKISIAVADSKNNICDLNLDMNSGKVTSKEAENFISMSKTIDVSGEYGKGVVKIMPGSIPDRMLIYADGELVGDTGFFADEAHGQTAKEFKLIPRCVYHLTNMYNISKKNPEVQGDTKFSKLKVVKVSSFEELVKMIAKDDIEVTAEKIDSWVKSPNADIGKSMAEMRALFNRGQREFVLYERGKGEVNYELKGDVKEIRIEVQSVIPKTQFKIKSDCQ